MQPTSHKRRLTAILAADVAGYSRMMASDDSATVTALDAARSVFRQAIEANQGRVIDMAGDSVLAVFDTAAGAIAAGLAVQEELRARAHSVPDAQRMLFRIGIHMGDVIEKADGTVYGDGVNVAARLESLAPPGGVAVSDIVYGAVRDSVPARFDDAGEHEVKNIARPVHAYLALPAGKPGTGNKFANKNLSNAVGSSNQRNRPAMPRWALPVLAAMFCAIGVILWFQPWQTMQEQADQSKMVYALPDKPSIAVLPFDNMTNDNKQDYFSDGMTEDIITDLSKISGLFVVARNSTFTYKGQSVKIRQVAEELGVRYILEGSVRRAADKVRINAQLIDAISGGHVWAERYDGDSADVFALQDSITHAIVRELSVTLLASEARALTDDHTNVPAAYDAFLLGKSYMRSRSLVSMKNARAALDKAIALDPDYSRAWAALAQLYYNASHRGYLEQLGILMTDVPAILEKALARPSEDALVAQMFLLSNQSNWDEIPDVIDRLAALGTNNASVFAWRGLLASRNGDADAAERSYRQALRLSPHEPAILAGLGRLNLQLGRYEAAVRQLQRSIVLDAGDPTVLAPLTAALVLSGQTEAAQHAVKQLIDSRQDAGYPSTIVGDFLRNMSTHRDYSAKLRDGLLKAGIPETVDPENLHLRTEDVVTGAQLRELIKKAGRATGDLPGGHWAVDHYSDGVGEHFWLGKPFARSTWVIEGNEQVTTFEAAVNRPVQRCTAYRNPRGSHETRDEFIGVCNSGVFMYSRVPIPAAAKK